MKSDLERCVELLQRAIRTPSLPGREGELAKLVVAEMEACGYDEVRTDEVGNVLGRVRGRGDAPPLMFNTHLDHVDVGDPDAWPRPPYGGESHDGRVWGRGAVDIKGPLAAQLVAAARLARSERPPGDVWVTCVVQEEIGGIGARHLVRSAPARLVVVGEPSSNRLRRGHRGRTEPVLHVRGRSVHASVPERGANPLISLGRFLARLDDVRRVEHPELGASTIAPTLVRTDQTSANVTPAEVWQTLDCRLVPGQSADELRAAILEVASGCVADGIEVEVELPRIEHRTWTGEAVAIAADNPAYLLEADHPAVQAARQIVHEVTGEDRGAELWRFATDGGHFAEAGLVPIGLGPGDELLAHTVQEHVEVAQLDEALRLYERMGRELAARCA